MSVIEDKRDIVDRLREMRGRRRLSERDKATISEAAGAILGLRETLRERTEQYLAVRFPRAAGPDDVPSSEEARSR